MFTLYYFIVFCFILVILSHSLLHYTTHYVATVYNLFINALNEVLQIWTAGHFSLHIGVTVRNLQGER